MDRQPTLFDQPKKKPRFDGPDYEPKRDDIRLRKQLARIWGVMKDSQWRTLQEIADLTDDPPASVSAQLRHLRKKRFGGHKVEKEHIANGLFKYRVIPSGKTVICE